jgi:tetratricopeptide (TPR) repeat protein
MGTPSGRTSGGGHAAAESRSWPLVASSFAAVALILFTWTDSLHNAFHFDDSHVIQNNLFIRSLRNVPRFFTDARTFSSIPSHASYRPLVSLTLAIDYAVGRGLAPEQYHRTQIALMLLLGALLVLFYRFILQQDRLPAATGLSLFMATLFCVHTANTETMNLISARSELLSVIGVIGSLLVYMKFPRVRSWGIHLLPMAVGALAKVHAVMYAPLLFAYVWLYESEGSWKAADSGQRTANGDPIIVPGRSSRLLFAVRCSPFADRFRRSLAATWPAFAAAAAVFFFINRMDAPQWTPGGESRWAYAWTQPWVWLRYFRLFFFPAGLTADTDWTTFRAWSDGRALAGDLLLLLIVVIVLRFSLSREARPLAFGLAWFAIALLPTSSIVPFAEVMNEHRLFFPFVGLTLAVVWPLVVLGRGLLTRSDPQLDRGVALIGVAVLLVFGAATRARNRVWRTEETLWLDVTKKSPGNGRGLMNYGLTLMGRGDLVDARNEFEKAALATPNYSTLHINLGIVYGELGQRELAEKHFLTALQLSPDADSHASYARWLARSGRGPQAIGHLRQALGLSPGMIGAREDLMHLYRAADDASGLSEIVASTLAIDPGNAASAAYAAGQLPPAERARSYDEAWRAGMKELGAGHPLEAEKLFLQIEQMDPKSAVAFNDRGWAQLQLGFLAAAKKSFERAMALDPKYETARNNLALAEKALAGR